MAEAAHPRLRLRWIAALLVLLAFGTGLSLAAPANATVLCSNSATPCPEGDGYPIGTALKGTLDSGSASFVGEKMALNCSVSSVSGTTTAAGTPVVGTISALSFSGCELGCTAEARNLPYKAEIEVAAGGDGTVTLSSGGSGPPQIKNFCLGQSCTMGAAKITLDLDGGSPAHLTAVNEPLAREGGEKAICGETAKWSASYRFSEPASLFVTSSGTRKLYFGISANSREAGTSAQEQAAETGVDRLREDLEWKLVEPSDDAWSWTATDTLFSTAAERGLNILPILNAPPCWAVPEKTKEADCERTYPTSDAEYAEFVSHVVTRYGPGGEFWTAHPKLDSALAPRYFEIWNEPYIPHFVNGELNPARYTSLYKAAVIAGRNANKATRYLVESTGDLTIAGSTVNWPSAMFAAESSIGDYIDGIAIHPYPYDHDPYHQPANSLSAAFAKTQTIYDDWKGKGITRPIWITEVGYSSCTDTEDCVFGETQAKREELKGLWLTGIFDQLALERYSYVHAVYLYNLRQWEDPKTAENDSSWYGILNAKAEPLPAWTSFADAVESSGGTPLGHALILSHATGGSTASFTFVTTDPTASASCQLDSGAWTACTSPINYTGLSAGSHTFRVKATNAEGTEPSPAVYSW